MESGQIQIQLAIRDRAPVMPEIKGCGVLDVVELGGAAGDNPGRMRSEASFAMLCGASPIVTSSGRTVRRRPAGRTGAETAGPTGRSAASRSARCAPT